MLALLPDDRASELLQPVEPLLVRALSALPDAPPLTVRVAALPPPEIYALSGDEVVLSDGLCGPELAHPCEPTGPLPPMDRWRRALGSVLEAASLRELSRRAGLPPGDDWRWKGAAIFAADRLAPELGLADPDVALAVRTGAPGAHPRAGVAVMRAWHAKGTDPLRQVQQVLEGGLVSVTEWLALGAWVLASEGARATLPVVVERVEELALEGPVELPAWSWRPALVPAHPRGLHLRVDGEGAVESPWAEAETELRTILAAASTACRFEPEPGGPVGDWEVASAEGFGQVMGARGIQFGFRADGRLEIVLADAFVGPLAAVAMAGQVGTSGICSGRWRVAGAQRLRFADIETRSLTLHSRTRDKFLMPAVGFGLGEWLVALGEDEWRWQVGPSDRLVMRGKMMGGEVEVRLKRGGMAG